MTATEATHHAEAVVTDAHGGCSVRTVAVGEPGPGEVLVEVRASGVCHTDLDLMRLALAGFGAGVVLGHEGAGVVRSVGTGVAHVEPGQHVVLSWSMPCHRCAQCARGNEHLCERHSPLTGGRGGHARRDGTTAGGEPLLRAFNLGTMATLTLVRAEAVVPIDDDVPFASAAIVGCAVMTGVGSVLNASPVEPGSSVVVLGCGGVGLNVVQGARIAGAGAIVAVDPVVDRLVMATELGATTTIVPEPVDADLAGVATRVRELTGGAGADVAFECTAVAALGAAPLRMIRHGGTAVQVSGIEQDLTIDMRLFEWDKTYLNPLYGQCRPARDFPRLFDHYRRGELKLDEQVTRRYRLGDAQRAFDDLAAGRTGKGVLEPTA